MDIKKTLDALRSIEEGAKFHFSGEKRGQKPGDQVRGTDKAKAKKSGQHPFAGRLVGAVESTNLLVDLEQQIIEGDIERRLKEEYAHQDLNELNLFKKKPKPEPVKVPDEDYRQLFNKDPVSFNTHHPLDVKHYHNSRDYYEKTGINPLDAKRPVKETEGVADGHVTESLINEADNEFVLYVNGKPVAKYDSIADARQQRDQLLQKFPKEHIQLKQEFCDLIDIEENSNMLPGLDSDSPIHGMTEADDDMFSSQDTTTGKYWRGGGDSEYQQLWNQLVPASGVAPTVEGELLRAASRLYYDWYNNGFGNNTSGAANFIKNYGDYYTVARAIQTIEPYLRGNNSDADSQSKLIERALEVIVDSVVAQIKQANGNYHPNTTDLFDLQDPDDPYEEPDDDWYAQDEEDYDDEDELDESDDLFSNKPRRPPTNISQLFNWAKVNPSKRQSFLLVAKFGIRNQLTLKKTLEALQYFDEADDEELEHFGIPADHDGIGFALTLFRAYEEICDAWNNDPSGQTSTTDSWENLDEEDDIFAPSHRVQRDIEEFNHPLKNVGNCDKGDYDMLVNEIDYTINVIRDDEDDLSLVIDELEYRLDPALVKFLDAVLAGAIAVSSDRFDRTLIQALRDGEQRYGTEPRPAVHAAVDSLNRGWQAARRRQDTLDETRIIDPDHYDIYYKPGRSQIAAQLVARLVSQNKVDAYIETLCDQFGVKPSDFEITPSSEKQVSINEYGMTTGGMTAPTQQPDAAAPTQQPDAAADTQKIQQGLNKIKSTLPKQQQQAMTSQTTKGLDAMDHDQQANITQQGAISKAFGPTLADISQDPTLLNRFNVLVRDANRAAAQKPQGQ